MALRPYQLSIYNAVCQKHDWGGSNVVVRNDGDITSVTYYGNKIAEVNHKTKTATLDNCGYFNASTTARMNAVKMACDDLYYKVTTIEHER